MLGPLNGRDGGDKWRRNGRQMESRPPRSGVAYKYSYQELVEGKGNPNGAGHRRVGFLLGYKLNHT